MTRQLAETAVERLQHTIVKRDELLIIEAAILDGRHSAFEELHTWLDNQGIARTVPCQDGSDDAVLWLVTMIRLYAKANPTAETAVWAGEAKKQAEARHDAEARLASLTAERDDLQTKCSEAFDSEVQTEYRRQQAETKLARVTAALEAIIYASDNCQGHRNCNHSMEPWQNAQALLRGETS